MRNIRTIDKDIERAFARIQKNKDAIAKAQVRFNNAVAKCAKKGYTYVGDGNDSHNAHTMLNDWELAFGPISTADNARESIERRTREITSDEMELERLRKEKADAEAEIKSIPQALQNYAVDLTKAFAYEYKTRRDIAVMRIKTLKEEGKWSNYDYWKSQGKCMWNVQDSLKRVAEATDEQLDIRAKEDAQALVKDLHHRIKSYIGATEDYSGLEVTTGTQGYAVINGFLTGTAGKCEVRSIECGGYNIVCWHIRVIVVRAK